jgi:hypothetical protein
MDGDKAIKTMSWCTKNNKQVEETRRNKKSGWETIDIDLGISKHPRVPSKKWPDFR